MNYKPSNPCTSIIWELRIRGDGTRLALGSVKELSDKATPAKLVESYCREARLHSMHSFNDVFLFMISSTKRREDKM